MYVCAGIPLEGGPVRLKRCFYLSQAFAIYAALIVLLAACGGSAPPSQSPLPSQPVLGIITLTPAFSSFTLGTTLQMGAIGTYTDGSNKDVTRSVNWSSSNERMVTLDSSGLATPLTTGGVTITAAYGGVSASTMLAVTPDASARLVWFTPDFGGDDMLALFSHPEEWPIARGRVQVVKFYTQQLTPPPPSCAMCGQNNEPNLVSAGAFSKLNQWGLDIGIESGALKSFGCTPDILSNYAKTALQAVQSNGGVVSYMAMDEPFFGGQEVVNNQTCNYTMEQSAAQTAKFVQLMHAFNPTLQIGDIEPYPYFTEPQLESWITALQAAGVRLPFFHIDVDRNAVAAWKTNVTSDLQLMNSFCESRGIAFGVIFNGLGFYNSLGPISDQNYYNETMQWVQTVKGSIGLARHLIFQSWFNAGGIYSVPVNLPENDPAIYSHTRLINDSLAALAP